MAFQNLLFAGWLVCSQHFVWLIIQHSSEFNNKLRNRKESEGSLPSNYILHLTSKGQLIFYTEASVSFYVVWKVMKIVKFLQNYNSSNYDFQIAGHFFTFKPSSLLRRGEKLEINDHRWIFSKQYLYSIVSICRNAFL